MFPHPPAVYEVRELERRELLAEVACARLVASVAGQPSASARPRTSALHVRGLLYALWSAVAPIVTGAGPLPNRG